ncbi:hypothetical protein METBISCDRAFT_19925 [Metschnikowia bicuspidata]|uniref:C2H2-type domain-containing protein n=1 Tax=Metschnikowia bicuspidata TaxID=27322 RepID=A0A4P9ZAS9_9ASCO|nr:hypothetical protein METBISCDRAFT_19925 [Metschnikowia bicuspidata]
MDSISNWDELLSLRRSGAVSTAPQDDDYSLYFNDQNFDSVFSDTLQTLQDLEVPPGFDAAEPPPQRQMLGRPWLQHLRQHLNASPFRHSKKPSGTAIFGFLGHNRELSLTGLSADVFPAVKPDNPKSISPMQLARPSCPDRLGLHPDRIRQPDRLPPPLLAQAQPRTPERDKKTDDIIVTKSNPKLYKFPPLPATPANEDFLLSAAPLLTIQYPLIGNESYPDKIDELLDVPEVPWRYVPIPVQQPNPRTMSRETGRQSRNYASLRSQLLDSRFQIFELEPFRVTDDYDAFYQYNDGSCSLPMRGAGDELNLNMNVFMPSPGSLLSHKLPEAHDALPQAYSLPLHRDRGPTDARRFYNRHFFSDNPEKYRSTPASVLESSPPRPGSLQSSPVRLTKPAAEPADDTVTDFNETILQLSPPRVQPLITPSHKHITLEWSPIISPSGNTRDVKRAIQDLWPKRTVKKTSLLPPGELDRYWDGPDANKIFTCTYENCGKKFTRRYNVRSHIQTHLSDRPFACTYCPKSFVRQHDFNRHLKSHMVLKFCRCRCGKEFTRVEGYRKHLANGVCLKGADAGGVTKPARPREDTGLDGLTSNRLKEYLELSPA